MLQKGRAKSHTAALACLWKGLSEAGSMLTNREPSPVGDRRVAGASKRPLLALEITGSFPPDDPERHRSGAAEQAAQTDRGDCFISPTLRRAWPPRCGPRGRHMRSRYRCSMCSAIHINSRSWLRSSSTHEPSDPPLKVIKYFFFHNSLLVLKSCFRDK